MKRFACLVAFSLLTISLSPIGAPAGGGRPDPKEKESAAPGDRLVIHEWGTFTCLQDEAGRAVTGVNTDDEPVPEFVHRISELIPQPTELAPVYKKGAPRAHRQVRMRLETPVLYFHPPANLKEPLHATVQVGFRGGWLTEYYPTAQVAAPGLHEGNFRFAGLNSKTLGTLEWNDLTIGGDYPLPETTSRVWLTPREVRAATVKAPGGEAEKYLFYRGVGNLPSPLTVSRTTDNDGIVIREETAPHLGLPAPLSIPAMWLVHVREDGTTAFRRLGSVRLTGEQNRELARCAVDFSGDARNRDKKVPRDADSKQGPETLIDGYSENNLARLRVEMRKELITDGLYADEADAMLKTWEVAYFKSPGLRLFYLLPHQWTDAVLPLQCSLLAEVSRTMVGRVELVTPRQRALLRQISQSPISEINWFSELIRGKSAGEIDALYAGDIRFRDLNIPVPADYQAYIDLGRFRDALILDAHRRDPKSGIGRFAEAYSLTYYTPEEDDESEGKTARGN